MEKLMELLERGVAKMGFCWKCKADFWYIPGFKNTHSCPDCGNQDQEFLTL
jgi:rRNA maturation endonuclease Nob1